MTEDALSASAISDGLGTSFIGQKVIYYPQVTSTNDLAKQEAGRKAAEGTVVITGEQIAGKGRIKRVWLTPRGNIALSILLYPGKLYLPYLVMVASLAVARTIEAVTGLAAQIKWPNDVLIRGKKVCGILVESDVRGDRVAYAVVGIGINVRVDWAAFPEVRETATSLSEELGRGVSRVELVRHLLVEFETLYLSLAGGDRVYQEWRDRLVTLGKSVRVKSGEDVTEGIAESVDRDGSLLLRHPNGDLTRIVAGDVTLRDGK